MNIAGMRLGIPMGPQGSTTYWLFASVIPRDGAPFFRRWTGRSIQGIHRAARARYAESHPGARVAFGRGVPVNSYGAH